MGLKTQKDLLEAAQKYKDNMTIDICLRNIEYNLNVAHSTKFKLRMYSNMVCEMVDGERELSLTVNDEIILAAAHMARELYALKAEYNTLATILEKLGEKVEY